MPRNGSGEYSAPTNSWNPAINSVPATAADWQAVLNDIVSAMTESVSRDGQTAMTGNLPMAGNKVTGLSNATATGDALTFAQLFSQGQQQDIASAETTDIGAPFTTLLNVTGTATITSFGTNYNGPRFLRFAEVCTLTNSATLVLPGGVNITTAAGDSAIAVPLGNPATGWRVVAFTNGVYTTGDQTIGGTKTFSSAPVVPGLNGGQLAGMRNLLINGNFQFNRRGYASGTNVGAANTYTLDRWRVVTSGENVTFTASGNGNQITAPAGGIEQVIEGTNIGGGTYVLNWTGTATATVDGTARAKGESFTLPANTNATVRLIGGTASQVQIEPGTVPTPFEHRPIGAELALCQRYYEKSYDIGTTPGAETIAGCVTGVPVGATINANGMPYGLGARFKTEKRTVPTITVFSNSGTVGSVSTGAALTTDTEPNSAGVAGAATSGFLLVTRTGSASITNNIVGFQFVANAEL